MQDESVDVSGQTQIILRINVNLDSPVGQLQRAVMPPEFGIWTLGSGLRDMIEALEPFLDEIWKISWALKTHTSGPEGPRTRDEIVGVLQDLEKGHAEFREFPVAKKLSRLLEEEPTLLPREWKIAFFSIIALRNCWFTAEESSDRETVTPRGS